MGASLGGVFGLSLLLFVIFYLMRANRKMKRELAEHEAKEAALDRVDMTPVPYTVSLLAVRNSASPSDAYLVVSS